jgi:hypothetical protein
MKMKILLTLIISSLFYNNTSAQVSHEAWDKLLKKHVTADGVVDYEGFVQNKKQINAYLEYLNQNPPQENWATNEKLAFWINTYNAATVKLIVDHYPVQSIQDLQPTFKIPFIHDVWHKEFFEIGGEVRSLNEVEHEILREEFEEPRIHFAINCASISCPKLRNEAYVPEKLEEQLDAQARYFINTHRYNQISPDQIKISKIFKWFTGDFTKNGSLIDFLNKYSKVKIKEDVEIDHLEYNWNLNNKLGDV